MPHSLSSEITRSPSLLPSLHLSSPLPLPHSFPSFCPGCSSNVVLLVPLPGAWVSGVLTAPLRVVWATQEPGGRHDQHHSGMGTCCHARRISRQFTARWVQVHGWYFSCQATVTRLPCCCCCLWLCCFQLWVTRSAHTT